MSPKTLIVTAVAMATGALALMASASAALSLREGGLLGSRLDEPATQVRVVVVTRDRDQDEPDAIEQQNDLQKAQQEEQLKAIQEQQLTVQSEQLKAKSEALKAQAKELQKQHEMMKKQIYVVTGRPKLGVVLRTESDATSDASGAYVEAVTPGGPADEAGIRGGDIITKFNGQALTGKYEGADEDESAPAFRLTAAVGKLKAGDKVTLTYLRGKETKTATLTLQNLQAKDYAYQFTFPESPEDPETPEPPEMPDMSDVEVDIPDFNAWSFVGHGLAWLDMEMVPMNPDLGEYFGTNEGILVVHAPADSPLKIKAGDVILKVGDRTPQSPSQVMRILRSYEPGEDVNLTIFRKHSKVPLSFKVPERTKAEWHEHGRHTVVVPAQPAPAPRAEAPATPAPSAVAPAAPAPPATPAPAAAPAPASSRT